MTEWEKQEGSNYWNPEIEGDELIGEVQKIDTEGEFGNRYTILKDDGEEMVTPSHRVLQTRMEKATLGQLVKIVFTGTQPPSVKGRNPTKMYDVFFGK